MPTLHILNNSDFQIAKFVVQISEFDSEFEIQFTIPNSKIRSANFRIRNCEVVWK